MSDEFTSDDDTVVDNINANVNSTLLDSRYYYYTNFPNQERYITHHSYVPLLADVQQQQSPLYIATFKDSLLVTWVGVECSLRWQLATSYIITVNLLDGMGTATTLFILFPKFHLKLDDLKQYLFITFWHLTKLTAALKHICAFMKVSTWSLLPPSVNAKILGLLIWRLLSWFNIL